MATLALGISDPLTIAIRIIRAQGCVPNRDGFCDNFFGNA
jgi:hypothetical protein